MNKPYTSMILLFAGVFSAHATNKTCFGNPPVLARYANIYSDDLSPKRLENLNKNLRKWHKTQHITVFDCHISPSDSHKNPRYKSPFKLQHTGCHGRQNRIELFANQYTTMPLTHYHLSKQGQLICPTIETGCTNYAQPWVIFVISLGKSPSTTDTYIYQSDTQVTVRDSTLFCYFHINILR